MTDRRLLLILCGTLAATPYVAHAQADPAIPTIEALDSALLDTMKAGKSLSARARYEKLMPVVQRTFDLQAMTRFAVGSAWSSYSPAEQAALISAFGRLSAANLAHNFNSYDGEQFKVNPTVETRGPDKLVRSQIIPAKGSPTDLNYRMRQSGGTWKVIDVYFGAISQLVAQRSDFASTAVPGGASKLVDKINAKADSLMKG
jgi:phospholipid transport system substrate-binding protein